ncbi:MAG TPA: hypothetical protein VI959_01250, partial [Alphaproteobacteria bacterium]|nr:hypothetical protein [Alphaproteobacteria bacterium]
MDEIKKVSGFLVILFKASIGGIFIFLAYAWFSFEDSSWMWGPFSASTTIKTPQGLVSCNNINWTFFTKILAYSSYLISKLATVLELVFLIKIFNNYHVGELFNLTNTRLYKKLSLIFMIDALLITPLTQTLGMLAATLTNPPGERILYI